MATIEDDFEVKRIIDHKRVGLTKYYLVKWRGFEEYSWIRESKLNCELLLERYRKDCIAKNNIKDQKSFILEDALDTDSDGDDDLCDEEEDEEESDVNVEDDDDKEVEMIFFGKEKDKEPFYGVLTTPFQVIEQIETPTVQFDAELFDKLCEEHFSNKSN